MRVYPLPSPMPYYVHFRAYISETRTCILQNLVFGIPF